MDVAVPNHVRGGTRLFVRINKEQNVIFKWQALHSEDAHICVYKYSEIHIIYISYVNMVLLLWSLIWYSKQIQH
jgi:hypothetical protein